MEENINAGIYIRVSTEEQAKEGFSIPAQKEKLTKYAEANSWNIYDIYIDDGISGKNLTARHEINRLLKDIKEGKVNNVLIYKLDRLTRSVKDLIYLIELFEKYKCAFNSQTEKIDTSNAVGRMFIKIIGIFAEFERENLAERVSFGYEQKTREGYYTNTNGVNGYDYIKGEKTLKVNEEERQLVNKIFDMYIDGNSYTKIAKTLNKEKVPTKRGGNWSSSTIKSIINNPLYIGKVRYGVNSKIKNKAFTVEGKNIESIINKEKWLKANTLTNNHKHFSTRRYPSEKSYYFHTIKCAKCGSNISPRQQIQRGKTYITYTCNRARMGKCDSKGFSHLKMENTFLKYLDNLEKMKPNKSIIENKEENTTEKIKKQIIQKLEKLDNRKKIIRAKFIDELLNIDEFKKIIKEIDDQNKEYEQKLKELNKEPKSKKNIKFDDIKNIISNTKLNWQYLNNKEKQQFLSLFIEEILVQKKDNIVTIEKVKFKNI